MNRFFRIVSLGAALCVGAALLVGCRDEKDISEKLELISEGCSKAISDESGEILVYKTVRFQNDVEGVLDSSIEETYVRFANNAGAPDFELTRDTTMSVSGDVSSYQFLKEGETMIELFNGSGGYATEAPDIFEEFYVDFEAADIESVKVTVKEKGFKEYRLMMTSSYANSFDTESDGLTKDCTSVIYCYYIDNYTNLSNILREFVYTVTYDGEAQRLVEFIDAKID